LTNIKYGKKNSIVWKYRRNFESKRHQIGNSLHQSSVFRENLLPSHKVWQQFRIDQWGCFYKSDLAQVWKGFDIRKGIPVHRVLQRL
jgi:hypothetical protein